jgi:hypothetical protein
MIANILAQTPGSSIEKYALTNYFDFPFISNSCECIYFRIAWSLEGENGRLQFLNETYRVDRLGADYDFQM